MKISLAEINSKVGDLKYNANLIKKHADIAIKNGAIGLFTEKYEDKVRTIKFNDSYELCGGCLLYTSDAADE